MPESAAIALSGAASRTDLVLAAIKNELECRRDAIDADETLVTISVIVRLRRGSATPETVIYRTEGQRERRR